MFLQFASKFNAALIVLNLEKQKNCVSVSLYPQPFATMFIDSKQQTKKKKNSTRGCHSILRIEWVIQKKMDSTLIPFKFRLLVSLRLWFRLYENRVPFLCTENRQKQLNRSWHIFFVRALVWRTIGLRCSISSRNRCSFHQLSYFHSRKHCLLCYQRDSWHDISPLSPLSHSRPILIYFFSPTANDSSVSKKRV